jgi:hypothetical protein
MLGVRTRRTVLRRRKLRRAALTVETGSGFFMEMVSARAYRSSVVSRFAMMQASCTVVACVILARAHSARADCALDTKVFAVPVWSTSPNEGSTWGAMPILMRVCPDDHRTHWLIAPDVTWNSVIHYTGTFRWYDYPDDDTTLVVIGSVSTRINYQLVVSWRRLPTAAGTVTHEVVGRLERNAFARFYGIGPDTTADDESSYTAARALVGLRHGINLTDSLNIGLTLGVEHDGVEDRGVPNLPLAPERFPDAPGMRGATLMSQGFELRYDDRVGGEFAERGYRVAAWVSLVEGIAGSPTFVRGGVQASALVSELDWLASAGRVYWNAVSSSNAPFYQQSQLGGSQLLRGFPEGRFTDRQAWTIELEQRIRLYQSRFFGVVTDWRIDPFVAAGQVFHGVDDVVAHPRLTVGAGVRLFVRPRLLARLDVATGGEGPSIYVDLGYPF